MSNIIKLLPNHVANQIAAGEVVQRPSSVVKELIENSIDAGATEIKLILKEAGKTLIQVIDNGKGMNEIDARMSFERHATSKISKAADLFALQTKGFRGEALASIAAISHVEMKSRTSDMDLGTHIIIEGSELISQEPTVIPVGTSFAVKNLFFNIPARRNFLKSNNVEFRNVVDEFERVALVHENIHFTLLHNGSEVFNLPPSNLRQRIVSVFGSRTNEKLVPIEEKTEIVKVSGFVAKPEFAKKSRGEQFFFVNNRYIKSGYLHHAILTAYEGLLKEGTHPSYFIYLEVPTDSIDINIHPTKTEVKFDDEQALYSILRSTIKHSLGQFNVAPVLDFQRDASLDTPYDYEGTKASTPTIEVDRNFNPFQRDFQQDKDTFEYNPFENPFITQNDKEIAEDDELIESKISRLDPSNSFILPSKGNDETHSFNSKVKSTLEQHTFESKGFTGGNSKSPVKSSHQEKKAWGELYEGLKKDGAHLTTITPTVIEEQIVESSLFDSKTVDPGSLKSFQINRKYIVSPIKSGLVIIDQGRAHQRILFEKFQGNIINQAISQQLIFPLTLYYSPYEIEIIREIKEVLLQTGFCFDDLKSDYVVISGLPVNVSESEASIVLEDLITEFQSGIPEVVSSRVDRISKSLAYSLAVKTGTILTEEEQSNLVNALFACKEPSISPYNKPTFITMNVEDIEKKFTL